MKAKIIFSCVFLIILTFVVAFVTFDLWNPGKETESKEDGSSENNSDVNDNDDIKFVIFDCQNLCMYENEVRDISNFVKTINYEQWDIDYICNSSCISLDNKNFKIKALSYIKEVEVKISIMPNFDVIGTDYESILFPLVETFKVKVLPDSLDLNYNIKSKGINNFDITISANEFDLSLGDISLQNNENILFTDAVFDAEGNYILKNVSLDNVISDEFIFNINLSNDLQESKNFSTNIKLKQDSDYLRYNFNINTDENPLYVTKNNVYTELYPNTLILNIEQSYDLVNEESYIMLIQGEENGVQIDKLKLLALKVGEYKIGVYISGELVETKNITIINIPIESAHSSQSEYKVYVNEEVDLSVVESSIITSEFAMYDISYEIVDSENMDATISDNGIFIATNEGLYKVRISVGNYVYFVYVNVLIKSNSFNIYDENGEVLQDLDIELKNISSSGLLYIGFKILDDSLEKETLNVSCIDSKVLSVELNVDLIIVSLDINTIMAGDSIVIKFTIYDNEENIEKTCQLDLHFI